MYDPNPLKTMSEQSALDELQGFLEKEIPMYLQMGIRIDQYGPDGLTMQLPLKPNRNHHQTAFAGSLNALCTMAGWGMTYLLLQELGRDGNILIQRSSIRYHTPVKTAEVFARCEPIADESKAFFLEMLDEKDQTKLDLKVEVPGTSRPAVAFEGSYVVIARG